ncbi:MAG TPA: DNA polymerase I [Terriglobales bacterium]|nr:DNA polymerase I [Terriglobales bacterium]
MIQSSPKGRVFLLDAMSLIFRAYHAMARQRPMSTRDGLPTAAVYVFVNMLRKLRQDFAPEYLAAVFDPAGPTFRDQQAAALSTVRKFDIKTQTFQETAYHGYKANRAETPPDLAQQFPYIRRALEGYGIPVLEQPGYEADDVLGTLARQAAKQSYEVYVVSGDKDMLQLVDDKVRVLNPQKDNLVYDPPKVEEILGVPPEKVVEVMALRGDSIDNIPGAPGIGDKGSVELIRRFGSVEKALERAAEVEKKTYRESLENNREVILLSKELATIDRNVPVELDLKALEISEPDSEKLRALFTELEFTSFLKELVPAADLGPTDYRDAHSAEEVEALLAHVNDSNPLALALAPAIAGSARGEEEEDAEAAKLPLASAEVVAPANVIAISAAKGEALTVSLDNGPAMRKLAQALADAQIPKAVHDWKSAIHALAEHGAELNGVRHETMLYSYLLDPTYSTHGLPELALRRFNLKLSGSLAEAADITGRLAPTLRQEVEGDDLLSAYQDLDLPLVPVLARMEQAGVKVDAHALDRMSSDLEREAGKVAARIYELAGTDFNINSPKQLGDVLYNRLKLPKPTRYGKGRVPSTAQDVLEVLAERHDVPRLVLEYRQLSKLKSTYVDALPELIDPRTGRLHTTFNQTGTATGRLSSTEPNLQNIPIRTELGREIRAAFVAEPGHVLVAADYSQIELRLLAHLSEDPLLVEAFRRGDDIHRLTAAEVFGVPPLAIDSEHRRRAKAVNFGIVYGLSPFGLSQQIGVEQREAKKFIDAYFAKYKGVRAFIDRTLEETRRTQRVRTLFGRVRPIPDINSKNASLRGFAERTAVNTPLQGTAADLMKLAMIHVDQQLRDRGLKTRMTLQIHDELVFEAPEAEVQEVSALVKERMERVYALRVPLVAEVGVGRNWRDLK